MLVDAFTVQSPNVVYTEDTITTTYDYKSTELRQDAQGKWIVEPTSTQYEFQVDRKVPKLGCVHSSKALGWSTLMPHSSSSTASCASGGVT